MSSRPIPMPERHVTDALDLADELWESWHDLLTSDAQTQFYPTKVVNVLPAHKLHRMTNCIAALGTTVVRNNAEHFHSGVRYAVEHPGMLLGAPCETNTFHSTQPLQSQSTTSEAEVSSRPALHPSPRAMASSTRVSIAFCR